MRVKKLIDYFLILFVNITVKSLDFSLLMNITGVYPPYVILGYLNLNDTLNIKILVPISGNKNLIELRQGTLTNDLGFVSKINVTSGNATFSIPATGNYYIISRILFIPRFSFEITINQKKFDIESNSDLYSYYAGSYIIRNFNFMGQCTIKIDPTQFSNEIKNSLVLVLQNYSTDPLENSMIINAKGEYQFEITPIKEFFPPYSYSIPIYYDSSKNCSYEEMFFCGIQRNSGKSCSLRNGQTCSLDGTANCTLCGNGVLDPGEECDKTDHCTSSCKPQAGYQCKNNTCAIANLCGNNKVEQGEYCDSTPHCTSSCKAQIGYTCFNNTCYNCGNSILQIGQECDNGNKSGCSSCKVVPPYKCKSIPLTSSFCYLCGNSIYELGEECDNGNQIGCINCTIDRGYKCKSKVNSISNCTGVCGDLILTADEQCDNGNMTGCINCVKDTKYNCTNLLLKPSNCYYCGNYILQSGEQCDNSNKKGCINCKIQSGYNCRTDPRYCFQIKKICGNGERQIEEQCDDGNKINGDGCNAKCKIQAGFTCSLRLGEKSSCQLVTSKLQSPYIKK